MSQIAASGNSESSGSFQIKVIVWSEYEHQTPILLQDLNGPCPLIALVNTLLLKNEIDLRNQAFNLVEGQDQYGWQRKYDGINNLKKLLLDEHSNTGSIQLDKLLSQLGDVLLVMLEARNNDFSREHLDNLLKSLPLLHTGLSVNPNLINGSFPSGDLSTTLFELFDLKLRHGWIFNSITEGNAGPATDPDRDILLASVLRELQTFDEIQDFLLYDHHDGTLNGKNEEIYEKQLVLQNWLENNATQLTDYGMKNLDEVLEPEEFVVFFRNNHFSTLYKKDHNDFYTLLTDSSFQKSDSSHKKIVWQSFISVSGNEDLFFTGDFLPVLGDEDSASQDQNYLLIKQLQEEEDEALAKRMQQQYMKNNDKRTELARKSSQNIFSRKEKQKSPPVSNSENKSSQKKKSTCTIV